jgi:hypothetical protein
MNRPSLSSVQAVVAIAAGILSVLGAVLGAGYTLWQTVKPAPAPATGQVLAILREWRSDKPVGAAIVEILTTKDELVTTLTSPESGRLQHALKEGPYRLRVSHPRFAAENRTIHVVTGATSEVRIDLKQSAGGSSPLGQAAKSTVDEGVDAVKRWFKDLGL